MNEQTVKGNKIRIILVSELILIQHALSALIRQSSDFEVIATAKDRHELLKHLEFLKPDLIVLDIGQSNAEGLLITKALDDKMPWIRVIILTLNNHSFFIKEMLKHGTKGFISKNSSVGDLFEGIRNVYSGKTYFCSECSNVLLREMIPGNSVNEKNFSLLTTREIEIISFLANGLTTKGIADKLFISQKTVERHKTNILGKLKLKNTAQLVRTAAENGLLFN
jgi:two-component system nitrate/nitrite response regulator NarL